MMSRLRLYPVGRPGVSGSKTRPITAIRLTLSDPMPEICRFLGIVITMYFDEHNPPHFHVRYNDFRAVISIRDLNILAGRLPACVRGLVEEWAEQHQFIEPGVALQT